MTPSDKLHERKFRVSFFWLNYRTETRFAGAIVMGHGPNNRPAAS